MVSPLQATSPNILDQLEAPSPKCIHDVLQSLSDLFVGALHFLTHFPGAVKVVLLSPHCHKTARSQEVVRDASGLDLAVLDGLQSLLGLGSGLLQVPDGGALYITLQPDFHCVQMGTDLVVEILDGTDVVLCPLQDCCNQSFLWVAGRPEPELRGEWG